MKLHEVHTAGQAMNSAINVAEFWLQRPVVRSLPHLGHTNRPLQPVGARTVLLAAGS